MLAFSATSCPQQDNAQGSWLVEAEGGRNAGHVALWNALRDANLINYRELACTMRFVGDGLQARWVVRGAKMTMQCKAAKRPRPGLADAQACIKRVPSRVPRRRQQFAFCQPSF